MVPRFLLLIGDGWYMRSGHVSSIQRM